MSNIRHISDHFAVLPSKEKVLFLKSERGKSNHKKEQNKNSMNMVSKAACPTGGIGQLGSPHLH